jgi:hypothetical protein
LGTRAIFLEEIILKLRSGGLDRERTRQKNTPEVMNLKQYIKQ